MRTAILGLLVGFCLAAAWVATGEDGSLERAAAQNNAAAQNSAATQASAGRAAKGREPPQSAGDLIALSHETAGGQREVTLIDAKNRVMAVYHIEGDSGEIALRSVRAIGWDLLMDDFNGVSPSPREIRSLVEPR